MGNRLRYPAPGNGLVDPELIPEGADGSDVDTPSGFVGPLGVQPQLGSEIAPYGHGGLPRKSELRTYRRQIDRGQYEELVRKQVSHEAFESGEELDIANWRTCTLFAQYEQPSSIEGFSTAYALGLLFEVSAEADPLDPATTWFPYPTVRDPDVWQQIASGAGSPSVYMQRQVHPSVYLTANILLASGSQDGGIIPVVLPFDVEPFRRMRVSYRGGVYTETGEGTGVYTWEPGNPALESFVTLRYQLSF